MAGVSAAEGQSRGDVAQGEKLYKAVCWTCHGSYGRGDGPTAEGLSLRPPDFTYPSALANRSDREVVEGLLARAKSGAKHTPMVFAATLKEDSLENAVAYMRTLAVPGKHVSVDAGRDIYNSFCWVCHGARGDGQGPAAENLVDAKPRNFRSSEFVIDGREEEIYETISLGAAESMHGSSYMLEWGTTLSPQQIRDVIAYIRTFQSP